MQGNAEVFIYVFVGILSALLAYNFLKYTLRVREDWVVDNVQKKDTNVRYIDSYFDPDLSTSKNRQHGHMMNGPEGFIVAYCSLTAEQIKSTDYTASYFRPLASPFVLRRTLNLTLVRCKASGKKTWVRRRKPTWKERWRKKYTVPHSQIHIATETKSKEEAARSKKEKENINETDFEYTYPEWRLVPSGYRDFRYPQAQFTYWKLVVNPDTGISEKVGDDKGSPFLEWMDWVEFSEKWEKPKLYEFVAGQSPIVFDGKHVRFQNVSWNEERFREFCQEAPGRMAKYETEIIELETAVDNYVEHLAETKRQHAQVVADHARRIIDHEERVKVIHAKSLRTCRDCTIRLTMQENPDEFKKMWKENQQEMEEDKYMNRLKAQSQHTPGQDVLTPAQLLQRMSADDKQEMLGLLYRSLDLGAEIVAEN